MAIGDLLHAATIAIVGQVSLELLWHAIPSFPTVNEVWINLLEKYGFRYSCKDALQITTKLLLTLALTNAVCYLLTSINKCCVLLTLALTNTRVSIQLDLVQESQQ
jgi:hypothetical protein